MVIKVDNYVLTKKEVFWFYKENAIPDYATPVKEFPAGYAIIKNYKNGYPFLKVMKWASVILVESQQKMAVASVLSA